MKDTTASASLPGLLASVMLSLSCSSGGGPAGPTGPAAPSGPGSSSGPYTLQVDRSGGGAVVGTGIECGATCSAALASGSVAVLSARPGPNTSFAGWSGCDQDMGLACAVSMTADRSVSATFTPCTGCAPGRPLGTAVQAEIDAQGGTLTSPGGGLTLTVPPGAVGAPTIFSIQPVSNLAPGGRGAAYDLGPSGPLLAPVTLTFAYSDMEVMGTAPEKLGISYQADDGGWVRVPSVVDPGARTITASVDHFTTFEVDAALRLNPAAASVRPGEAVVFYVDKCAQAVLVSPPQSISTCYGHGEPNVEDFTVLEWAVDGVPGGTSALGTISGSPDAVMMYRAPAVTPSPSTVTVSVRLRSQVDGSVHILLAEVTIGDPLAIRGVLRLEGARLDVGDGWGYTGKLDVRQSSVFLGLKESTLYIEGSENVVSTCTITPNVWPVPLLAAAFEPGDVGPDTYQLGGLHSGVQDGTETCTDRVSGESSTHSRQQISWSALGPGATPVEFPGSLRPNSFHAGEFVNHNGQVLSWTFFVLPSAMP